MLNLYECQFLNCCIYESIPIHISGFILFVVIALVKGCVCVRACVRAHDTACNVECENDL